MPGSTTKKIQTLWDKLPLEEQRELLTLLKVSFESKRMLNRSERDNIYLRGNRWYVRLRIDGRDIRRSAGTSTSAEDPRHGTSRATSFSAAPPSCTAHAMWHRTPRLVNGHPVSQASL